MKRLLLIGIALLFLINFVNAEPVCCERTIDGNTCQYVDSSECSSEGKSAPTNCAFTSFCKPGTCFSLEDGRCYENMPLATCAEQEQTSFGEGSPEELPQCQVGCCIIGNEASLVTQTRCKKETSNYPDLEMVFKENIKDEAECVTLARSSDKGCCVTSSDTCTYTTRANCELKTGTDLSGTGFFKNRYCSDQNLICDVVPQHKKGCLPGSDDVYWFDSAGNPEDVAENCDYVNEQTTCGKNENGEYECLDLSCKADYDLKFLDKNSGKLSTWKSEGEEIKTGESWCEYDSKYIGFGKDVPGSRYYRGLCINNKIRVESCKDFREEFCISDTVEIKGEDYMEAACRANRWEDCTGQNNRIDCENTDLRDCTWTNNGCKPFVPPGSKFWEDEPSGECSAADSVCVVTYRVGGLSKYLAGGGKVVGINDLFGETTEEATFGLIQEIGKGTECISGCDCLDHDYIVKQMNNCRTLGDCGAHFNMEGTKNDGILRGLKVDADIPTRLKDAMRGGDPGEITFNDLDDFGGSGESASDEKQLDQMKEVMSTALVGYLGRAVIHGVYGIPDGLGKASEDAKLWAKIKAGAKGFGEGSIGSFYDKTKKDKEWQQALGFLFPSIDLGNICGGTESIKHKLEQGEYPSKLAEEYGVETQDILRANDISEEGAKSLEVGKELIIPGVSVSNTGLRKHICAPGLGQFSQVVNHFLSLYSSLALVDAFFAETETVTITTTCESWQAPTGSLDCEECNPENSDERENKLCSEYACKSFGQACALINEGTGNESCVTQNPYDTNSPIIKKWDEALTQYNTVNTPTGYRYNDELDAFTIFPLAITTNEPAQCKMDLEDVSFDEMETYFGASLFSYDHLSLTTFPNQVQLNEEGKLEIIPGGDYTVFVKCQDSLENVNERPYTITFSIKEGPDTTPPVIEGSSIASGSYVQYGINQTDVTVYVNEPAECKWSTSDKEYEEMENELTCNNININEVGLFECETTMTPIIDQVLNTFFVRCKDKPGVEENDRNVNSDSFKLTLRGSVPLELDYIEPSGTIHSRNFTLEVGTSNGATLDGKAYCYYDGRGEGNMNVNSMIEFAETNATVHKQVLSPVRSENPYNFTVICIDYGGNMVNGSTSILMERDVERPYVKRIYRDDTYTPAHLKVILNEEATCEYSEDEFTFGDGILMNTDSKEHDALYKEGQTYYIMCMDASNNLMIHVFHA